jgi:curved DNA-binding protein CbpA
MASRDPYALLGVKRTASDRVLGAAWLRGLDLHDHAEKRAEVQDAYDLREQGQEPPAANIVASTLAPRSR